MALRTAVPSVLCGVTSFGSARTAVVAAVAVEAAAVEVWEGRRRRSVFHKMEADSHLAEGGLDIQDSEGRVFILSNGQQKEERSRRDAVLLPEEPLNEFPLSEREMTPVPRESYVELSDESRIGEEKLLNASCTRLKRPHSEVILTELVLSCITLLTATLNMMVIISISLVKQLHTPTNLLLLSLAVSDFFVGFLIVIQMINIDGCWHLNDFMCSLFYVIECSITSVSVGNMVLISLDRYVAICDPMHYSTKVTPKRVKVCVCLCWISSIIFQTLLLRDNLEQPGKHVSCHGECVVGSNSIAAAADIIFTFIGPITVIVVLYVRVFAVAVSQARAMRAHVVTLQGSVKVTAKKSEIKAARTLGVVVVVFLICICPYYCVFLSSNVHNALSVVFVACLFYFNSCLNPVIYAFFYPWFRKCLRLIFTLQILKPGSREANIL